VNCGRARYLIHETIDSGATAPGELAAHLAACPACRAANARLRFAQDAFDEFARRPVEEDALTTITGLVPRPPRIGRDARAPWGPAWARPVATACAVAAVFALGAASGRWLWPAEVVRTELNADPQVRIVEKPVPVEVLVPVEVVRERIVTRRVPVYISRPATEPTQSGMGFTQREGTAVPAAVDQLPVFSKPVITNEIHPTTIVDRPRESAGETVPTSRSDVDPGEAHAAGSAVTRNG